MITAKDILRTEYLTADKEDTLTRVNSRIKDEAFSEVLVFDNENLIGIFSPSRASMIFPSKEDMEHMRIKNLVKSINMLDEDTGINEVMAKILATGYNIVPISKKGKVIGIVHIFNLLGAFNFDGLKAADMVLQKPVELSDNDRVGKAVEILHEDMNKTILVRDKENNTVGILNQYDLLRNLKLDLYKEDRQRSNGYRSEKDDILSLPISDFIREKNFVSVSSKDTIRDIIGRFKANNVTSLIVKDTLSLIRPEDILRSLEKSQMVKARAVDFVGLDELKIDDFTIDSIKKTTQRSFEKIEGIIQQDAALKVHIKRHFANSENKRHKYSVVLHLGYPGNSFSIENVSDWDLKEAVRMAINKLENSVKRIFKTKGVEARDSVESYNAEA
jgi:predicted transcriptional regulator